MTRRYTPEEIEALRLKARALMAELTEVFEEIAEKVTILGEEMVRNDDTGQLAGALAEIAAKRSDDRSTGG